MYYETAGNAHGLPHDPFKALVVPRPIGWISTRGRDGSHNLAPYSFFNAVESEPPIVVIGSSGLKDTARNVLDTGEFVCNLATWDLREQMNQSSAPLRHGVSEFAHAGLTPAPSRLVAAPRVAESPVTMECVALSVTPISDRDGRQTGSLLIMGQVVAIHIDDSLIVDGRVDITLARPIARLGYMDYAVVDRVFTIARPRA